MKYVTLNNGLKMPILGFGVYQITDLQQCEQAVVDAIEAGYRLIDTAAAYGNEEAVGKAIKRCGVAREELFITTKVWISETGYENTMKAFENSMAKLQLDYLDLYLIHQPYGDLFGSWRAMNDLAKAGKTKAIGVSNLTSDRLLDLIINSGVIPAVNQIEVHPFFQQFADQEFMIKENVQTEAWAPFAEGKFNLFHHEVLSDIGKKHNKSVAQVVLRWIIQRDIVVIPKSTHKERIIENFNVFDFELSQAEMDLIRTLDAETPIFFSHRDPEVVRRLSSHNR
jgi:2,5-diketo-D-gluconate reductase A